jgi:cytochrome c oxidase subunit 1
MPVVHRWAYDYSVPGYHQDFIPQNVAGDFGVSEDHDHDTEMKSPQA